MNASVKVLTNRDCMMAAKYVADQIPVGLTQRFKLYGIPRGGISASYLLAAFLPSILVDDPAQADIIVDDLIASGETMNRYAVKYPNARCVTLFTKGAHSLQQAGIQVTTGPELEGWLVFPWEVAETGNDSSATSIVLRMLEAIGEDVTRQGLLETPKRVVASWQELYSGYNTDPKALLKVFEDGAEKVDEMVLLTHIPINSMCEHHMVPFIGEAHIAYIPNGKIVGISKLARVADAFARRLQVQERLTNQIADCLNEELQPLGVGVVIKAKHFCMCMRGVKTPNTELTTSALRGCFKDEHDARAEFFNLIKN